MMALPAHRHNATPAPANFIPVEHSVTVTGNSPATSRIETLLEPLRQSLSLRDDMVAIPGTGLKLLVTRPADTDALLDQSANDPEQNLPYWAELWPSGIALAAAIHADPASVRDLDVLELGSGVGITAALALEAGANLLATDYAPESLALTAVTCLRHTGREPRTLRINWRQPGEDLLAGHPEGFPVVLAADVLYERRDIEPLLTLFERIVAPGGLLWLAEPGRPPASIFLESASRRGWSFTTSTCHGPWPDPNDAEVVARVHRMRRKKWHPTLDIGPKRVEKEHARHKAP